MTVQGLMEQGIFNVVNEGDGLEREITTPFCCDLLSIAMGRAPAGCAWVTVMGNMNTLAVAALTDAACVVLAEGAVLDEVAKKKAADQEITLLPIRRWPRATSRGSSVVLAFSKKNRNAIFSFRSDSSIF